MYDSWRSTDPAGAGAGTMASVPPNGQHPQLISSAWRIRNLSEIQAAANGGCSANLGPEVAVAQDNSRNEGQESDKMAPVANSELGVGEKEFEKMLKSSFSSLIPSPSSSSLPQSCGQNRQDFPQSIASMASTTAARSQLLDSISDLQLVDETEAVRQRPSDGALPVSTGSCRISYTNGHVTGSEVSASDEKAGYMNLRHKSRRKPVQDRPRPKRQAARDMCRPLKQWLYCHRDTPYPSKAEKQDLALLSRMTLTQVSNWFANARRRLKNTVSGPEVTWRRRIKLYNQFVVGNQELLSVSSDDTMWDDDDDDDEEEEEEREWEEGRMEGRGSKDNVLNDYPPPRLTTANRHQMSSPSSSDVIGRRHRLTLLTFDPEVVDLSSPAVASPSGGACCTPAAKFKQGILQRYLTDAYERVGQNGVKEGEEEGYEETEGDGGSMGEGETSRRRRHGRRHRNGSGSLSSHDYEEEMSLSARSTPTKELHQTNEEDDIAQDRGHSSTPSKFSVSNDPDDLYWMEISAALALTNLAMRSRLNSGSSHESSPHV